MHKSHFLITVAAAFAALVGANVGAGEEAAQGESPVIEPRAADVLGACTDYVVGLKSFKVRVTSSMAMKGQAAPVTPMLECDIIIHRPNKVHLAAAGVGGGNRIVCDGRKVIMYMAADKKYTEEETSDSLDGLSQDFGTQMLLGWPAAAFVGPLLASDPREQIMAGVTKLSYVGVETIDEVECHRIRGEQEHFDWDMWIEVGPRPLMRRCAPDLSRMHAARSGRDAEAAGEMPSFRVDFADWQTGIETSDDQFTFKPPDGASLVESLYEGMLDDDEPHPSLGEEAPAFSLKRLDGSRFELAEHKDKHVVVLDFWASWCGPCVQGLPSLAKLAKAYSEKGVVVCAVNQSEDADTIKQFLREKKLDLAVALDTDGEVGQEYGLQGIPHTVVIDKKGIVQAVHSGFGPGMDKKLESEVEAVLAGKDLATETKQNAGKREPPDMKLKGLELAWHVSGQYEGVAGDSGSGTIYAASYHNRGIKISADGEIISRFRTTGQPRHLRQAKLQADAERGLVGFQPWGQSVLAYDANGKQLWEYPGGDGVDDVWVADLDGDGLDEVIIGHNGSTGLHVLGPDGELKWKDTSIGNVWHVCVGDVTGDGKLEVVTTSAQGQLHVFSAAGKKLKDIKTPGYSNLVRVARLRPEDKASVMITEASSVIWGSRLFAIDYDGKQKRLASLPRGTDVSSAQSAASKPWMGVAMRDGKIRVIDLAGAETIGSAELRAGYCIEVTWLDGEGDDTPLLLVATGRGVFAFRVTRDQPPATAPAGS